MLWLFYEKLLRLAFFVYFCRELKCALDKYASCETGKYPFKSDCLKHFSSYMRY